MLYFSKSSNMTVFKSLINLHGINCVAGLSGINSNYLTFLLNYSVMCFNCSLQSTDSTIKSTNSPHKWSAAKHRLMEMYMFMYSMCSCWCYGHSSQRWEWELREHACVYEINIGCPWGLPDWITQAGWRHARFKSYFGLGRAREGEGERQDESLPHWWLSPLSGQIIQVQKETQAQHDRLMALK